MNPWGEKHKKKQNRFTGVTKTSDFFEQPTVWFEGYSTKTLVHSG